MVIMDDIIATGGSALAAAELVQKLGANLLEFAFFMELDFLKGREKLASCACFHSSDWTGAWASMSCFRELNSAAFGRRTDILFKDLHLYHMYELLLRLT